MSLNAEVLRSSLELVVTRQPELTPGFYERLFTRYPQVKPLFGRNAAEAQQKMLQDAIVAVVDHAEDAEWLGSTLRAMGRTHRDYGVTAEMYPWVGECLIDTLAAAAGDDWSPEIAKAWTDAFGAIQGLMLEGAALDAAS
jgi:hemoglobin-like flavoprotein